ncbi:mitochondrial carrier domain-containing protein [Gaertneriomyces semiglobifer]|nr:mitochondrial carrier domain-containing protein [Gaertneriomyces semiglobifer]
MPAGVAGDQLTETVDFSRNQFRNTLAGAVAGCVSAIITCPLDVVKIRLQNQQGRTNGGSTSRQGTISMLKSIWRTERIRGLYRGLGPTMCGYLPTWAIYFSVYEWGKTTVFNGEQGLTASVVAAMMGGCASTLATNPLWVIRTRVMTQPSRPTVGAPYYYSSTPEAFNTILRTEGIRSLYRGLVPSLFGVAHVAFQFPLYETLKAMLSPADSPPSTVSILIASAISKMTASIITYPHEVIRTRLQTSLAPTSATPPASVQLKSLYSGVIQTAKALFIDEGWRGFYKGLGTNLVRTVPASAATILTFELLRA